MRQDGGRPSPGMRPRVLDAAGRELAPALTVLIVPRDPAESTAFFRFQVMKIADPRDLYERALSYLQADYFQRPETFSDRLTAVLPASSRLAAGADGARALRPRLRSVLRKPTACPARCAALKPGDAARDATIWHNRLFNPALPDDVLVARLQAGLEIGRS